MPLTVLNRRYGTWRGAVRLGLAHGERLVGRAGVARPEARAVARLVFVCQGNICRSAYAEATARAAGLNAASFGLSTGAGLPAHGPAVEAAARLGRDLTAHLTTRAEDYRPRPGDLLLAMETRQLRRIAGDARLAGLPRVLLGDWARPRCPHLHDPFGLDPGYFLSCFRRIDGAVLNLARDFPGASAGG